MTTDYGAIGTALAIIFIAFMQVWNNRKQAQIAKTVEVVHKLTNSNLGEQLKIGMISALTLANQTGLPEHKALADVAVAKFRLHEADQAKVDAEKN